MVLKVAFDRRAFLAAVPVGACAAPVAGVAVPGPTTTVAAPATTAPSTGPAVELVHATSGRPEVALTFHGTGDLDLATKILTGFADRGASVTVLAIGTWLQASPDAAKIVTGHGTGNVTADGTQLWLSGCYCRAVHVLSTVDGHLIKQIPVCDGPHGLCVWPQPGRYSLGHTGITR